MANGPLGGFMPTPPSPGQPPQVKLETSAESRGAFNKFLGTLPSNGAIAPIQTGVDVSSTTPVSPVTSNVNIFQPQMSQMAPMPMMPPAQPVQMMFNGGMVDDFGDPGISFDTSDPSIGEDVSLSSSDIAGGTFDDGDSGVSFTDDSAGGVDIVTGGQPTETPGVVDTRPRTNIRNVGPLSNLRFDPQFTADLLGRRFGDSNIAGFMSKDDFAQTRQGGASVAPVNLSTGLKTVANLTGPNQFVDPSEGIAPVTRRSGVAGTGQTGPVDLLGLGDLGFGGLGLGAPNRLQELQNIGRKQQQTIRQLTNQLSDAQSEVIPESIPLAPAPNLTAVDRNLTGISGIGADLSSPQSRDVLDNQFTQIAGLPTIVPGAGGLPSIDTVADDLVQGAGELEQRSGANINNPGNIRTGGGFDGEIGVTKDGFAIFDNMKSGVDAINKLATTYGKKRNINTVREFANRYSPPGENTAKQIAGKIDVISNALNVGPDEKVDFTDPNVQAKLTPAVITSEIGADKTRDVANVLRGFDPKPLDDANVATEPFTSFDVARPVNLGIAPIGEQRPESRGNIPSLNPFGRARPDLVTDREDDVLSEIAERNEDRARSIADRGFPVSVDEISGRPSIAPTVDNLLRLGQEAQQRRNLEKATRPDQALETLEGRRDRLPDQVFDIETITPEDDRLTTVSPDVLARIGREQRIDDANTFRQTVPDAAKIFGGRQITTTPRGKETPRDIDQELSPIVAAGIGAPEEFRQPFPDAGIKIGNFTIPTLTSGLNLISDLSRQRVFDAVLNKGATPVYDGDVLVGAKINGVLVEGMDPNAPIDSGDNQDPITKFLRKATEDKKEEDKDDQPPNQIGDVVIRDPEPPKPTVVKSTAPASTASFTPVGFNVGNLNDLIARITGVPTPRRMQEGGTVAAVDKFLSKVA